MTDEFDMLNENASELGLNVTDFPAVSRLNTTVDGRVVSAVRWGTEPARVVLLHGGGQNAHTWDSVLVALGVPALAIDLPGHGHSQWRDDGDYRPLTSVDAVAAPIREYAPSAELVVGMSLGGLTAVALASQHPDLVKKALLVDVSPESPRRVEKLTPSDRGTVDLVSGPRMFDSLDELVEATAAAAPGRSRSSIRRGVVHNTRRTDDGRWTWRYDAIRVPIEPGPLWSALSDTSMPISLVRGGKSAFVTDADVEEMRRRRPDLDVTVIADAGHSVQSHAPRELASIIGDLLD